MPLLSGRMLITEKSLACIHFLGLVGFSAMAADPSSGQGLPLPTCTYYAIRRKFAYHQDYLR
jgi:hypothetical protein